ncbi:MAG: RHS repeat-associated core domain-containing protein [Thermoanaerobaculia bacterium]
MLRQYRYIAASGEEIFADGFESGDLCAWSSSVGGPSCDPRQIESSSWYWILDYVYRDAQLLAEIDGGELLHLHVDHLGSLRQVTDTAGEVVEDHDFLPSGEEITPPTTERLLFTGHERDSHGAGSVDDLDYMHARYCSPHVGRFLSVDPVNSPTPRKPQSWNRYSYAHGNPIKFLDPDGRTVVGYTGLSNAAGGITEAIAALQRFSNVVGAARTFRHQDDFLGTAFLLNEFESGRSDFNVLTGHSLGAFAALATASRLNKIGGGVPVDLLLTVDAALNFGTQKVPGNVGLAINFSQPGPSMGGTQLVAEDPAKTRVLNIELRGISHTGIDDFLAASIVGEILNQAAEKGKDFELREGLQFLQGELIFVRE